MTMTSSLALVAAIALLAALAAAPAKSAPLVLDKETGHYKDMSYEALRRAATKGCRGSRGRASSGARRLITAS